MVIFRFLGWIFFLLAILFLALGVFVWLDGRATQAAGRVWFELHLNSLNNAEVFIARYLNIPDFWRDSVLPFLQLDAWEALLWLVIGSLILSGLLIFPGRRHRRRVSSFS